MSKSKLQISYISRLILTKPPTLKPISHFRHFFHLYPSKPLNGPTSPFPIFKSPSFIRHYSDQRFGFTIEEEERFLKNWMIAIEKEKEIERDEKRKAGINVDEDEEEEEDFMGVNDLIEKLEKQNAKEYGVHDKMRWDPCMDDDTDYSNSEDENYNDPRVIEEMKKTNSIIQRKRSRYEDLLKEFSNSRTYSGSLKCLKKIDKFEQRHVLLRLEYRVIGELLNRFREATGKDKFVLAQKLNRAMKLVEWKKSFDPRDPTNYGVLQTDATPTPGVRDNEDESEDEDANVEKLKDDEEEVFDDLKERDDKLIEKLKSIDQKLEEKLTALDYTFGRKGKLLEEEIRILAEERNSLTEKKRTPMYRKGFDVKLIDMNRTCKVTKGGRVFRYTVIVACGNYNGVVGYAKAKGPAVPIAVQKAHEKCYQNLHYIDRYEDHTIAHAILKTYKKTKVYLWPAKTDSGVRAGKTVRTILTLAGFKNVKSKVVGSRNPLNTVKALFQALNDIETPKDVQEKFGRTVVESHLL